MFLKNEKIHVKVTIFLDFCPQQKKILVPQNNENAKL